MCRRTRGILPFHPILFHFNARIAGDRPVEWRIERIATLSISVDTHSPANLIRILEASRPLKMSRFSWIPAFAGMTAGENVPFFVIPAKAGIQGVGPDGLFQQAARRPVIPYTIWGGPRNARTPAAAAAEC